MADVFVSYKREDLERARIIIDALEAEGFSVWYDLESRADQSFYLEIDRELARAKAILVLWTSRSVRSEWVIAEADYALDVGTLISARLDDVKPPLRLRVQDILDLRSWHGDRSDPVWRRLIARVERLLDKPPGADTQQNRAPPHAGRSHPVRIWRRWYRPWRNWALRGLAVTAITAGAVFLTLGLLGTGSDKGSGSAPVAQISLSREEGGCGPAIVPLFEGTLSIELDRTYGDDRARVILRSGDGVSLPKVLFFYAPPGQETVQIAGQYYSVTFVSRVTSCFTFTIRLLDDLGTDGGAGTLESPSER